MKLFPLLVAVFLLTGLSAQKATVKWGAPLDLETTIQRFLAEENGKFFTLSGRKDDLYLERYNSITFKQEFSKKLEIPELEGKEQSIEAVVYLQSRFLLFTSLYDSKLNTFTVHAYSFNSEGVMSKDSPELFSIEAQSRAEGGDVSFLISEDSTRILVTHYAYFKKEKMQVITMTVLDEKLARVTQAKEEFPRKEDGQYHLISNYALNNFGEIFLLHMEITPAVKKVPSKTKYTILSFGVDGKRQKDFPIDLEGKRIDRLSFAFDVNQNLLVSGFYEAKAGNGIFKYSGISGTFFMSIDKNSGEEKAKSFKDFDKDVMESYYEPKQLEKGALLPANFVFREIIQKADGGVVSVYEQYSYSYSSGNGQAVEVTFYGDLLVTNINPDGTIKWVKIIPKRQIFIQRKASVGLGVGFVSASYMFNIKSDQTIYYSYLIAITGDKISFVFNDDPANKDIQPAYDTEVLKKIKGAVPMMVTLTEGGEISKKTLFAATDFDIIIRPRIAFQSSDTRILIYGSKGDNDKFGVMTIE
jgi:hypothetical protein